MAQNSQSIMEILQCEQLTYNTNILTSHDFSWLQKGQLNTESNFSIIFLFGGGLLAFFLRPIAQCWK